MYALTEKVVTVRGVSISSYATDNERYKANIDQCRQ